MEESSFIPRVVAQPAFHVLAIVGPTAAGKSALAMQLGRQLPIEIVCCDSQQVYLGMDIGTGKPTIAERQEVPHHLLDLAPPSEPFHAARWAALARIAIRHIAARRRVPVIVGGTGLYLRALVEGLFEAPQPEEEIRRRHRDEAARFGVESLHARLALVDPETARRVQPRDLMRIGRALEVHEQTGVPISELRRRAVPPDDIVASMLSFDLPLDLLRERIVRRFDAMMDAGFLDEASRLRALYGSLPRPLQALGYRQLGDHLDGRLSLDEAVAAAKAATIGYARRQRTWFRKDAGAWRVPAAPDAGSVVAWWRQRSERATDRG